MKADCLGRLLRSAPIFPVIARAAAPGVLAAKGHRADRRIGQHIAKNGAGDIGKAMERVALRLATDPRGGRSERDRGVDGGIHRAGVSSEHKGGPVDEKAVGQAQGKIGHPVAGDIRQNQKIGAIR